MLVTRSARPLDVARHGSRRRPVQRHPRAYFAESVALGGTTLDEAVARRGEASLQLEAEPVLPEGLDLSANRPAIFSGIREPKRVPVGYRPPLTPDKRKAQFPHLCRSPGLSSVGLTGFEPATPCPPDKCANQAALQPADTSPWLVEVFDLLHGFWTPSDCHPSCWLRANISGQFLDNLEGRPETRSAARW